MNLFLSSPARSPPAALWYDRASSPPITHADGDAPTPISAAHPSSARHARLRNSRRCRSCPRSSASYGTACTGTSSFPPLLVRVPATDAQIQLPFPFTPLFFPPARHILHTPPTPRPYASRPLAHHRPAGRLCSSPAPALCSSPTSANACMSLVARPASPGLYSTRPNAPGARRTLTDHPRTHAASPTWAGRPAMTANANRSTPWFTYWPAARRHAFPPPRRLASVRPCLSPSLLLSYLRTTPGPPAIRTQWARRASHATRARTHPAPSRLVAHQPNAPFTPSPPRTRAHQKDAIHAHISRSTPDYLRHTRIRTTAPACAGRTLCPTTLRFAIGRIHVTLRVGTYLPALRARGRPQRSGSLGASCVRLSERGTRRRRRRHDTASALYALRARRRWRRLRTLQADRSAQAVAHRTARMHQARRTSNAHTPRTHAPLPAPPRPAPPRPERTQHTPHTAPAAHPPSTLPSPDQYRASRHDAPPLRFDDIVRPSRTAPHRFARLYLCPFPQDRLHAALTRVRASHVDRTPDASDVSPTPPSRRSPSKTHSPRRYR